MRFWGLGKVLREWEHIEREELDMTRTAEVATTGMFLFEGFRDYMNDAMPSTPVEAAIGGVIEQAEVVGKWAEQVHWATVQYIETHGEQDFPGVLAYEVWNPVGWWLAEQYGEHGWNSDRSRAGHADNTTALFAKVKELLDGFFAQGKVHTHG